MNDLGQVLQNLNVWATNTRIRKSGPLIILRSIYVCMSGIIDNFWFLPWKIHKQ